VERITVGALFDRVALGAEDREAFVFPAVGVRWTYRDVHARVTQLAKGLMGAGVGAGDTVAVWATNQPEWVLLQLAVAKAGAILVPLAPDLAVEEVAAVLAHSGATTLFTVAASRAHDDHVGALADAVPELAGARPGRLASRGLPHLKRVALIGGGSAPGVLAWPEVLAASAGITDHLLRLRQDAVDPLDPAVVQYVPGTAPLQGAELTHVNVVNDAHEAGECMRLRRRDRLCVPVALAEPLGHVLGTLAALGHGCPMIVPSEHFDAEITLATVAGERCTALLGTPAMFGAELAQRSFHAWDVGTLRTGIVWVDDGVPPPRDVVEGVIRRMHAREITVGWGRAEVTAIATQTRADDPIDLKLGTVGSALPGLEVKIIDPATGREAPRGTPGEVYCRGYAVMRGYRGAPEATAAVRGADGWLRTGDVATMDEQGYCRIVIRPADQLQNTHSPELS
jgi:fatty-acyl-CoA synthase